MDGVVAGSGGIVSVFPSMLGGTDFFLSFFVGVAPWGCFVCWMWSTGLPRSGLGELQRGVRVRSCPLADHVFRGNSM